MNMSAKHHRKNKLDCTRLKWQTESWCEVTCPVRFHSFFILPFALITRGKFWIGKVIRLERVYGLWLLVLATKFDQRVLFPGCSMLAAPLKHPKGGEKCAFQGGFKATYSLWHGVENFIPLEWPAWTYIIHMFPRHSQVKKNKKVSDDLVCLTCFAIQILDIDT